MKPRVLVLMGSPSDADVMAETVRILRELSVPYAVDVVSAHRTPDQATECARLARDAGIQVIIAAAGLAAHLAGVIAANTTLPVIGVPLDAGPLRGVDAALATLQMPGGIPVATMAIGKPGAVNAGLLAASILSLADADIKVRLDRYRDEMRASLLDKAAKVRATLGPTE